MGMFSNFEEYMYGAMGLKTHSMTHFVNIMTDKLFNLKKQPNRTEILEVNLNKVIPYKFYLIQYNYNGNKIWCPILTLGFEKNEKSGKNILFAINLEYLPPKYKIIYFNYLFRIHKEDLSKIADAKDLTEERQLPFDMKKLYNDLKRNGDMNHTVTGYDYLKIAKSYMISIKIAPEILMCDPKRYNSKSMKELFIKLPESEEKDTLAEIIKDHDKLIENYQEDSIKYHKQVALFEKHLKIIK